ncbi:24069_t:CDS:1, partial [Gigaspora margarita]
NEEDANQYIINNIVKRTIVKWTIQIVVIVVWSRKGEEVININNVNSTLWSNKKVTINSYQVTHSYFSAPIVHIRDITNAMPRQFFEYFMPVNFIISVVCPLNNKCAHEYERGWYNLT